MSHIFLDTSAYAAFRRGHSEIHHRIRQTTQILVSPVVLGELRCGFLKGSRQEGNLEALRQFLGSPRVEVVPIEESVAERYSLILDFLRRQGTPIPANDVWIAAGAMARGATIVTTDRHFRHVPQVVADIYGPSIS